MMETDHTQVDNIFDDLPSAPTKQELFNTLASSSLPGRKQGDVKIERIVSFGHQNPPDQWYDQSRDEWVMLVQGEAVLVFEQGNEIRLRPGDHVLIPAHRRHRVAWTTPEQPTIWLAVHF